MRDWLEGFEAPGRTLMLIHSGNRMIANTLAGAVLNVRRRFRRWRAQRRQDSRRLP
jgi:hypothetical protein